MNEAQREIRVLVVEDGSEYLTNLTMFVAQGVTYEQAQSGPRACESVARSEPDVVYLDMRFDRTPIDELLGDLFAWLKATDALVPTQPNPQFAAAATATTGGKGGRKNRKQK